MLLIFWQMVCLWWTFEPITKSLMTFRSNVIARKSSCLKTRSLWQFWPNSPSKMDRILSNRSKGTHMNLYLSFAPITEYLWPSVQKLKSGQTRDDGQTDLRDLRLGHYKSENENKMLWWFIFLHTWDYTIESKSRHIHISSLSLAEWPNIVRTPWVMQY